ncbi:flagellar hook-basal body complex protein FliE [Gluconacetobacter diazotrophicus PA1 5]|uniref:Flagellar hook-basal body complex protein FliE n=2 Tax=Gluconacetobacter diazotrophicus TaxID=33996 RepID=A9HH69_GLUDA|nr:flagellar hook-basal body complex protein FliE [Gluconacetobacter diazotrophicus]ACI53165.1 flagellar hook-basal body complex protein FliE [Gluconacetobacter diazotrophicus PA1 5]MBB2156085.1 flagellar hook-basal body protein FliE [Gluconacetobacter diazotrophicus]CAP55600.1 putative flagellar hook-basal body complex protein fliE [Gluconacetobacter diazotrophicus PA1 5]
MISDIATRSLDAVNAYGLTQKTMQASADTQDADPNAQSSDVVTGFSDALNSAIKGAIKTGKTAEAQTAVGLSGKGNLTDIATSVEEAKLTLQTVTAVRDRVVQAYQNVMQMTI